MKKRLVLIMLTALLLLSLAVNVSAVSDTYYPYEFTEIQIEQDASSSMGVFSIFLEQDKAYIFKILGQATQASGKLNAVFSLSINLGGASYGVSDVSYLIGNNNPIHYCTIKTQASGTYSGTVNMSGNYQSVTWRVYYAEVAEDTEAIDNAYSEGLQTGLSQGRIEGYEDGYEQGLADGSESENVLKNGFEGFFNGMANFMNVFMDVGIGELTIRNMVGLCVIAVLVIAVIKVVRG